MYLSKCAIWVIIMSKLANGIRRYILFARWAILLSLFLIHIKWDSYYSFPYTLLILFNIWFTWLHYRNQNRTSWKIALFIELAALLLTNAYLTPEIQQLYYLYTTCLLVGIIFSKEQTLVITFIYSALAAVITYSHYQQNTVMETLFPLFFFLGFILFLLMTILWSNITSFIKKWLVILRYIEEISNVHSMKKLHQLTEKYAYKMVSCSKCYVCLFTNNSFIDDWKNQYYTKIVYEQFSHSKKHQVMRIDYLGDEVRALIIPISTYRADQNSGALVIPFEKKRQLDKFHLILVRILLTSFSNRLNMLLYIQDQAASMKEDVRNKMAQDMHDGLAQQLFFLSAQLFQIKIHASKGHDAHLPELIRTMEQYTLSCQQEVRSYIAHLKGEQKESNIYDAIQQLIRRLTYQTPVEINLNYTGEHLEDAVEVEETIYRIIEESVHNILKHAQATTVSVNVERTVVQWTIKVIDNGIGFDPYSIQERKPHSYGLSGLKERVTQLGGHISLHSKIGNGTEILAVIPRKGVMAHV